MAHGANYWGSVCEDCKAVDEAGFCRIIHCLYWSLEAPIKYFLEEGVLFSF